MWTHVEAAITEWSEAEVVSGVQEVRLGEEVIYEVFKDAASEWRVRVVARNGEPINVTEGYKRKSHALKMASKLSGMDVMALVHNNLSLALTAGTTTDRNKQINYALAAIETAQSRVKVVE